MLIQLCVYFSWYEWLPAPAAAPTPHLLEQLHSPTLTLLQEEARNTLRLLHKSRREKWGGKARRSPHLRPTLAPFPLRVTECKLIASHRAQLGCRLLSALTPMAQPLRPEKGWFRSRKAGEPQTVPRKQLCFQAQPGPSQSSGGSPWEQGLPEWPPDAVPGALPLTCSRGQARGKRRPAAFSAASLFRLHPPRRGLRALPIPGLA